MKSLVYQDLDTTAWIVESGSLLKYYDSKSDAYREAHLLDHGLVDSTLPYFTQEADLDKISSIAYKCAIDGINHPPFDLEGDLHVCAWNIGFRLGVNSLK